MATSYRLCVCVCVCVCVLNNVLFSPELRNFQHPTANTGIININSHTCPNFLSRSAANHFHSDVINSRLGESGLHSMPVFIAQV
jgi:hypothetical protein